MLLNVDAVVLRASPNSLSAVRSFGRAGLKVALAAIGRDTAIRRSRYVSAYIGLASIDERAIETLMTLPTDAARKPLLMPTGDQDVLLVAKHREQLSGKYCFVVPSHDVLMGIVDKSRLYESARRHDIPHPRFHVVRSSNDIEDAIRAVATPCYVKPALSHQYRQIRRSKLEIAGDSAELRRILLEHVALGLVSIPIEIIPGSDADVHSVSTYIDRAGRPLAWRTKRKLRQFPLDFGDGCAQEITHEPEVAELGLRLLAAVGHCGPATVEFRRDVRSGRHMLMEINARTILGQEMITRSGLDAPLLAFHEATGRQIPQPLPAKHVRWIFFGADFRAFRELRKRGAMTHFTWLRSVVRCRSFAYFAWDDPLPFASRALAWMERLLMRRFRNLTPENL